jgi:hypothetical protein
MSRTELKEHITFMLPETQANIATNEFIDYVISACGGGTLINDCYGYWINPNKVIVDEPVKLLDVYCKDPNIEDLEETFLLWGKRADQHSVAYTHNGTMIIMEVNA